MIKTIKIDKDTNLVLSNNLSWATTYKNQFGHDIVPDVMPIISAIANLIGELYSANSDNVVEMFKSVSEDTLKDALLELCGLQFVDFIHLVWALAKANDEDIEDPDRWVKRFDYFPIDIIAPSVYELLSKGLVSSKNLKSLRNMMPKANQ